MAVGGELESLLDRVRQRPNKVFAKHQGTRTAWPLYAVRYIAAFSRANRQKDRKQSAGYSWTWGLIRRNYLLAIIAITCLSACEERYRYPCQNPDNFAKQECQKPKCQFTQMCPEYLVAPILEKQANAQSASEPQANR